MSVEGQWNATVEQLYGLHFDSLYRIGWRCLSDRTMVRDVIQEIFARLLTSSRQFPTMEDAERYLFRSFKNLLIDKSRSRKRWQYVDLDQVGGELPTAGPAQEENLVSRRLKGKCLPLPQPDRSIFELAYFEKKSDEEIASQLDLKLSTIRYRLRIARRTITSILTEQHQFGQREVENLFSRAKS